jgi:hypothetical protein
LLIKFQSGNPELWIEAGEQVRAWVNDERSIDFFEEAGSSLHEEGEEEDQMMMMNPNLVETETGMEDLMTTKMMAMLEIQEDQRVVSHLRVLRCWLI